MASGQFNRGAQTSQSDFSNRKKGRMNRLEREEKRQRGIKERYGAVSGIPLRNTFVFCVDEQCHATSLTGGQKAPASGSKQELSTQTTSLHGASHRKPGQSKNRHLMASKTARDKFGSTIESDRSGADAVKAKDSLAILVIYGEKCLGPTLDVALASMTAQKIV